MDIDEEIKKNKKAQAVISQRLRDLATTRNVFTQEALRLEGELRLLNRMKEEGNTNETPKENTEVPREQDSK